MASTGLTSIVEGVFTMTVAVLLFSLLPVSLEHPRPLLSPGIIRISPEDGKILQRRIAADSPNLLYTHQHINITPKKVWKTVLHWQRWPHLVATSLVFSTWSPFTTYTPSIIMCVPQTATKMMSNSQKVSWFRPYISKCIGFRRLVHCTCSCSLLRIP
jgi:hypothetical protein